MLAFLFRSLFILTGILFLIGCGTSSDPESKVNYSPISAVSPQEIYSNPRELVHFDDYVLFLKGKALSLGVSEKTLQQQQQIYYIQRAVELDHKQAGIQTKVNFSPLSAPPVVREQAVETEVAQQIATLPKKAGQGKTKKNLQKKSSSATTRYLRRVMSSSKLALAKELYHQYKPHLQQVATKFNVPAEYIVALWGMESGFGRYQGKYDVLSVLATLAFEGRRENLFSREFIAALQMLDQNAISREKMLGSWAGAMGQTQFMPSSYLRFAVDADQDQQKDIWQTKSDVFASVANYLSSVGWQPKLTWGVEVLANRRIIRQFAGTEFAKKRTLKQWQKLGVKFRFAKSVSAKKKAALMNTSLWLVSPDNNHARVFLVTNNYRTLLHWNRSHHFALSIGMFAEQIKSF